MLIYQATNQKTGKFYVGQTVQPLRDRVNDHKRKALIHGNKGHLHNAIRRDGFDAFTWTAVDRAETRDELNKKEQHWIFILHSDDPSRGYNMTLGGDAFEFTEETKRKIGEAGRGIKRSNEFKENLRKRLTGQGNHFYGKTHDEETRRRCGIKNIGRKLTPEHVEKCTHKGEDNWKATVTAAQVLEIIRLAAEGVPDKYIRRIFGITKNTLQGIKNGRTWRHLI